jgi:hypothetical protein
MNLVSDLGLPPFDHTAADYSADRYHRQLAETRPVNPDHGPVPYVS